MVATAEATVTEVLTMDPADKHHRRRYGVSRETPVRWVRVVLDDETGEVIEKGYIPR